MSPFEVRRLGGFEGVDQASTGSRHAYRGFDAVTPLPSCSCTLDHSSENERHSPHITGPRHLLSTAMVRATGRAIGLAVFLTSSILVLTTDFHAQLSERGTSFLRDQFKTWRQPTSVEIALDGSWKDGKTPEEFNDYHFERLRSCREGGPCPKNVDKLVRTLKRDPLDPEVLTSAIDFARMEPFRRSFDRDYAGRKCLVRCGGTSHVRIVRDAPFSSTSADGRISWPGLLNAPNAKHDRTAEHVSRIPRARSAHPLGGFRLARASLHVRRYLRLYGCCISLSITATQLHASQYTNMVGHIVRV